MKRPSCRPLLTGHLVAHQSHPCHQKLTCASFNGSSYPCPSFLRHLGLPFTSTKISSISIHSWDQILKTFWLANNSGQLESTSFQKKGEVKNLGKALSLPRRSKRHLLVKRELVDPLQHPSHRRHRFHSLLQLVRGHHHSPSHQNYWITFAMQNCCW